MRNTRFGLFTVVAVLVTAAVSINGCGGGGGSKVPFEPTPTPGATPTPVVNPTITFDGATPDCGSILTVGQGVSIKVYVNISSGSYTANVALFDSQGSLISGMGGSTAVDSSGYYYITVGAGSNQAVISLTLRLDVYENGRPLNPPVTQTATCGWTWK